MASGSPGAVHADHRHEVSIYRVGAADFRRVGAERRIGFNRNRGREEGIDCNSARQICPRRRGDVAAIRPSLDAMPTISRGEARGSIPFGCATSTARAIRAAAVQFRMRRRPPNRSYQPP